MTRLEGKREKKKTCGKQAKLINSGRQLNKDRFHKGKAKALQTHAYK